MKDYLDLPRIVRPSVCPERNEPEKLTFCAIPLSKQLVGAQLDGVSLNNSSLLQRQYDEEFGVVDPASDIHTDAHLLQDALMRNYVKSLTKSDTDSSVDAE